MDYASTIRTRRTELGLSEEDLARMLSSSPARIRKWESGELLPNLMQVPFLCAVLSLSYPAFFGLPPKRGRQHRRPSYIPSYQISYLPVMCNHTMRYYREKKKLSVEDMAAACQVTPLLVTRWEAGTAIPRLDMIPVICRALGIPIWKFFE